MESTLLTSPAVFSRFPASKTPSHSSTSLLSQLHNLLPSTRPSQLAHLRVNTTCHHGLNRFGSMSFGAGYSRPVPKNLQTVSCSGGNIDSDSGDVILLDVTGMMCGGCADSVKRILESQPQVSSAMVELTTETATVCPVSEAMVTPNWQQQLGEALAKHLTTCGFKSSVRDSRIQTTKSLFHNVTYVKLDEQAKELLKGMFHLEMQKISSDEQPANHVLDGAMAAANIGVFVKDLNAHSRS